MPPTLTRFREQCTQALASSIQELYDLDLPDAMLEEPPSLEFGQLASSVPFELGKKFGTRPMEIAKKIADRIDVSTFDLIDRVEPAGSGYVNFHLDFTKAGQEILTDSISAGGHYGLTTTPEMWTYLIA